jgi:2-amino-1-hydroxyethylphosphonate dioxygenase (glycine-forming)
LTAAAPIYYNNLSEASKRKLEFQSGVMSNVEVAHFESDPLFPLYIRMRLWDEQAKNPASPLPDLSLISK